MSISILFYSDFGVYITVLREFVEDASK